MSTLSAFENAQRYEGVQKTLILSIFEGVHHSHAEHLRPPGISHIQSPPIVPRSLNERTPKLFFARLSVAWVTPQCFASS